MTAVKNKDQGNYWHKYAAVHLVLYIHKLKRGCKTRVTKARPVEHFPETERNMLHFFLMVNLHAPSTVMLINVPYVLASPNALGRCLEAKHLE